MFGGIKIDPQQMQQMQQNIQICAEHPECIGCPLYSSTAYKGSICENALIRLAQNQNAQTSS